jgi:hypothetical protein
MRATQPAAAMVAIPARDINHNQRFWVPESRSEPTGGRFGERIVQVGPGEGGPSLPRPGCNHPAVVLPRRGFCLGRRAAIERQARAKLINDRARYLIRKLRCRGGTNVLRRGWACMSRALQRDSDGVASALAIHLCVYCAVGGLFALVLYYLMLPTRLPNPGIAALKPSAPTISYVERLRSEREAAQRVAVDRAAIKREVKSEPEPETTGAAARNAAETKPDAKKAKTAQAQRRTRPVRQAPPAQTTHYAQQPFFGGYQPMY